MHTQLRAAPHTEPLAQLAPSNEHAFTALSGFHG
jgi:hypothetical protein